MSNVKFIIPKNLEDLSKVNNDAHRYIVSQEYSTREVNDYIEGLTHKLKANSYDFVWDDFEIIYSALRNFKNLTSHHQTTLWRSLIFALTLYENDLSKGFQNPRSCLQNDVEEKLKMCNTMKMLVFSICSLMEMNEALINKKWGEDNRGVDARKSTKKKSSNVGIDNYEKEREKGVKQLFKLLIQPIQIIFSPPVVEEEFINSITKCCWKLIENQSIHRNKNLVEEIFTIIGYSIEKHSQSLGFCLKIIQLLQHKENLVSILSQMVSFIVKNHNQGLLINEIIREIERIDIRELSRDSSGPRAISSFLCEIAERCPHEMKGSIASLLPFLEQDSYMMRNATLSIIGTVVSECLSDEKMSASEKKNRDALLDKLELHVHDIGSFTRGRAIQVWSKLCEERKIPINRFEQLMESVVGRLQDKTAYVRKAAVHFLTTFLKANIFRVELNYKAIVSMREKVEEKKAELIEIKTQLEEKGEKLAEFDPLPQWEALEPLFRKFLEEKDELDSESDEEMMNGSNNEDEFNLRLVSFLDEKNFSEAFRVYKYMKAEHEEEKNKSKVPELDKDVEEGQEDEEETQDEEMTSIVDGILNFCKKIYLETAAPPTDMENDELVRGEIETIVAGQGLSGPQDLESIVLGINRQESIIEYLSTIVKIIEHLRTSIPLVCALLFSKNITDVQEAIEFVVTAYEYGMKEEGEAGLRKMITLIFTAEATKKEIIKAYRRLLIEVPSTNKSKTIVKNLMDLVKNATLDEMISLQELLHEFMLSNDIDKGVINLLWDIYSLKSPNYTEEEVRIAIQLISMLAASDCQLIRKNLDTLVNVGLSERAMSDLSLVRYTCSALSKAMSNQGRIVTTELPYRLPKNHSVFERISKILVESFSQTESKGWLAMQDEAVRVIYNLAEHPDVISEKIIYEMINFMLGKKSSKLDQTDVCKEFEQHLDELPPSQVDGPNLFTSSQVITSTQVSTPNDEKCNAKSFIHPKLLSNFITFIGNVTLNLLIHLEVNVFTELKTRNALKEESEKRKSISQTKVSMRRKSGRPSMAPQNEEDELGLTGVVTADDAESEFITGLCNEEIVNKKGREDNLLYRLSKLVIKISSDPKRFPDVRLRSATSLTLGKMMLVSEHFCRENLRLLFTIMTKSTEPLIRSNTVIVVGDLCVRFPNHLEQWTPRLYDLLCDDCVLVRTNTLKVLSRLILSDMVKVHERISEIAKLMCDQVDSISSFAKLFFIQLSKKLNAVYNVLPDIISRLSNSEVGVDRNDFQFIMRFLFDMIDKERHTLGLLEKLCQRFKGNSNERQWYDLAFCLSLLKYSDKSITKLYENFSCFSDKLFITEVYDLFAGIITTTSKTSNLKPETKALIDEFQTKLSQAKSKGLEEENQIDMKPDLDQTVDTNDDE